MSFSALLGPKAEPWFGHTVVSGHLRARKAKSKMAQERFIICQVHITEMSGKEFCGSGSFPYSDSMVKTLVAVLYSAHSLERHPTL